MPNCITQGIRDLWHQWTQKYYHKTYAMQKK